MMPQNNNKKRKEYGRLLNLCITNFRSGPLQIRLIDEITKYREFLNEIIEYIYGDMDEPADVRVNYCQNAVIKATGDVTIGELGVYHSKIHSGGKINIKGFCREAKFVALQK